MDVALQISGENLSLTHGNPTLGKQHLACGHAGCVLAARWIAKTRWISRRKTDKTVESGKPASLQTLMRTGRINGFHW